MEKSSSVVLKVKNTDSESRLKSFANMRSPEKRGSYDEEYLIGVFNKIIDAYKNSFGNKGKEDVIIVDCHRISKFIERGWGTKPLTQYERKVVGQAMKKRNDVEEWGTSRRKKYCFV